MANIKEIKRLRGGDLVVAHKQTCRLPPRLAKKTISGLQTWSSWAIFCRWKPMIDWSRSRLSAENRLWPGSLSV
ncbi:hypothetical protein TRIP_B50193 [uncultured Desulfatiglans sp.]|uniref:Uncharacterized protein n=1 Tax=Uncultured Desulfatiglans sp. TaxID=1748965 RepID=A0A653AGN2_UNCDX|nr:hypothetical protein TRIP_B50193 [uncultured Desulfatiglans sp.]